MTTREPPNLRQPDSCITCVERRWDMENEVRRCGKYNMGFRGRGLVCDDYEAEVTSDNPQPKAD